MFMERYKLQIKYFNYALNMGSHYAYGSLACFLS